MKIACLYARVSTNKQDADPQLIELRGYCSRNGWAPDFEFVDAGISGGTRSRPGLDRLMEDARRRRFQVVVVWKFDRFARSVPHLVEALDEFNQLGVDFVSISENIDTTTPHGRLYFTIVAAVAEYGRSIIRENVKQGLEVAKERLKKGPYTRKGRDGKDVIVTHIGRPYVKINLEKAQALRAQGLSWGKIAFKMMCSENTLKSRLKSNG